MKITIIGAGIGGLTTAIALEQKRFEVEIHESFPQMKRIGAGIVLANNVMQVQQFWIWFFRTTPWFRNSISRIADASVPTIF